MSLPVLIGLAFLGVLLGLFARESLQHLVLILVLGILASLWLGDIPLAVVYVLGVGVGILLDAGAERGTRRARQETEELRKRLFPTDDQ